MTAEYDEVRRRLNTGELYVDYGPGLEALEAERTAGKELVHDFNLTRPSATAERERILRALLGSMGEGVWIEPTLRVSYGSHVSVGSHVYANFGLVLVDDADVRIGDRVLLGPNVVITTAGHPIDPVVRATDAQFSAPVTIEEGAWLGAGVVVLPGVTIGAGSVIGSGRVGSRSSPGGVVGVGTPCGGRRAIGPEDAQFAYRPPAVAPMPR